MGTRAQGRRGRRGERGAALLVAIVSVAVLTALAVGVAYETRVSLEVAGNARDELRATWLARSGIAMSRLVLGFQQRIDDSSGAMCGALAGLTGGATAGGTTTATATATTAAQGMPCPRPQLWNIVPVSSGLVQALFGGGPRGGPDTAAGRTTPEKQPKARFGDFEGAFDARIDDEGRKANAQLDALATGPLAPEVQSIYQLVCDPRWDMLFSRDDANGVRISRQDLLVYLRDFVDDDEVSSALQASFPGPPCVMIIPANNPFAPGFGDENLPYQRGPDPYKAKNARFDSLDELHLVAGVSDAFMAAFGDHLTVYLAREAPRNVNTVDRRELVQLATLVADPPDQPMLSDPALPDRLQRAVRDATIGGFMSLTPMQFAGIVQAFGIRVNTTNLASSSAKQFLTDRSYVFRIHSAGTAGSVTKSIDAVVTYDPKQNTTTNAAGQSTNTTAAATAAATAQLTPQQLAQLGNLQTAQATAQGLAGAEKPSRIIHWREE
jgi:general secretion pathway protein K